MSCVYTVGGLECPELTDQREREYVPSTSPQTGIGHFLLSTSLWSCTHSYLKWSEVVAVGQNLRSISSQAGLQLLNVLVTLTLSHRSFNYDTDYGRVWIKLGDWHCGLETFMLGPRSDRLQSSITACSTGQSANHLHHRGDGVSKLTKWKCRAALRVCLKDNFILCRASN